MPIRNTLAAAGLLAFIGVCGWHQRGSDIYDRWAGSDMPGHCSMVTVAQLNHVLGATPLTKLIGLRVLEITGNQDRGSTPGQMRCHIDVLLSTGGPQTLAVLGHRVNGRSYLGVGLPGAADPFAAQKG
jgi:hypothetical protein